MKKASKEKKQQCAIHNVSNCADYEGFYEHLKEYEDNGIPTGMKDLIRLARQYNCEIPKLVNGKLVFNIRN